MKTSHLIAMCSLYAIGNIAVSCNSCDNKNNDPIKPGAPQVSADGASTDASINGGADSNSDGTTYRASANAGSSNGNSNTRSDNYANGGRTAGSPSTMGTAVNKSRDVARGKSTSKKSKSGYSAPNGTDAENHDGDPYTKHDTTSMPTGTSIR